MTSIFQNDFLWLESIPPDNPSLPAAERYQRLVAWAGKARGRNPNVFDELTGWMLEDGNWAEASLEGNRKVFIDGVVQRFREQNAALRRILRELEPHGVVNAAVFAALDEFDAVLAGDLEDKEVSAAVQRMLMDFSAIREPHVRALVAGQQTGPSGTDGVNVFGFVNILKNGDAQVQWSLFMPDMLKHQQKGFSITQLDYVKAPAMRFVGKPEHGLEDANQLRAVFAALDALGKPLAALPWDIHFSHHSGKSVDVQPPQGYWGRFFPDDTPVPDGFAGIDFTADPTYSVGPPYFAHYAFSVFSGDMDSLHDAKGFDVSPMYDITRNIMLGQGVIIPYPEKYWTAEIFRSGHENPSDAYLFSTHV